MAEVNGSQDDEHLNGSTAGFGKKLRQIHMELKNEDLLDGMKSASQSVIDSASCQQSDAARMALSN